MILAKFFHKSSEIIASAKPKMNKINIIVVIKMVENNSSRRTLSMKESRVVA